MAKKVKVVSLVMAMMLVLSPVVLAGGVGLTYQEEPLLDLEVGVIDLDVPFEAEVQGKSESVNLKDNPVKVGLSNLGIGLQTEIYKTELFSPVSMYSVQRVDLDLLKFDEKDTGMINEFNLGAGLRYEKFALDLKAAYLLSYKLALVEKEDKDPLGGVFRGSLMVDFVELFEMASPQEG